MSFVLGAVILFIGILVGLAIYQVILDSVKKGN